jgi:hypothetical protein
MRPWILLASVTLAACAGTPAAFATARVTSGPLPVTPGVYVPVDARATIRIDRALDTALSSAGQTFIGRLIAPLRGADGRVLAIAGARVDGHVAAIELGGARTELRLSFDRIETVRGAVPVAARDVSAQQRVGPAAVERDSSGAIVRRPARLVLPAGALIDIALVRPLILRAR